MGKETTFLTEEFCIMNVAGMKDMQKPPLEYDITAVGRNQGGMLKLGAGLFRRIECTHGLQASPANTD